MTVIGMVSVMVIVMVIVMVVVACFDAKENLSNSTCTNVMNHNVVNKIRCISESRLHLYLKIRVVLHVQQHRQYLIS